MVIVTKHEQAIEAAETIRKYCQTIPNDGEGCVFKKDEDGIFWKGCFLADPDHLPETWELEKIRS